ncbi:SGNH hydrolase domain-containing protein [Pseudooceanicola sp. LIPI14-2-Ac024]|uniref:SGNH hydrolase domain-containing protein n=1 Tax=Pseudooceanicola sp. LIPI14-2-Ac024 TaxID=3344875 RepID=UPI0035CEA33D
MRQVTGSACPPVLGVDFPRRPLCRGINDAVIAALAADRTARVVVLALNREAYGEVDEAALQAGFRRSVERLAAQGRAVVLVGQIPNAGVDAGQVAGIAARLGRDPARIGNALSRSRAQVAGWDEAEAALAARPGVLRFDAAARLCDRAADLCPLVAGGRVLYFNPTHVSMAGAERIAAGLLPVLHGLLSPEAADGRTAAVAGN